MKKELLKDSINEDWLNRLAPFIESTEFDAIANYVSTMRKTSVVCPSKGDTFKALNLCSYDDLKVVLAAQDPYHTVPSDGQCVADGLAFSCSYTKYPQPSLKHIESEIFRTTGSQNIMGNQYNLSYLAKQGVLLINKSLTVSQGRPNSHQGVWDKFHNALFNEIAKKNTSIVYMLLGADSRNYFSNFAMPERDVILTAKHPASAVYNGGKWDCEDIFNLCNEELKSNNLKPIEW